MKSILRFASIAAPLLIAAFSAAQAKLTVEVNGKPVLFKTTQPQSINGRTMVPLRGVFETIGAYVEYDPVTKKITARMNNEDVILKIGEKVATKNGAEVLMDIAPIVKDGAALVPLRFLTESLGAKVEYDEKLKKISISVAPPPDGEEPPLAL